MEWLENNTVKIDPPKKPKKLTATRFATILGLNPWSTPFEVWCEVTRTYQKPFEDTIYTIAGKVIEPKQAEYMKKSYFMTRLVKPADIWGEDYFKKTWGDFFPDEKVLGGMWDYLNKDKDGNITSVLEMKTTKRVEDWGKDVPEYYALQAALYAYLLKVDSVIMVASFLEDKDYEHPENFTPSAHNTITVQFKVSERYPDFEKKYVKPALNWWKKYVEKGISPEWDEKKDAEILKALRTISIDMEQENKEDLLSEAESLKAEIDAHAALIKDKEARYKTITEAFKKDCKPDLDKPGINKVEIKGSTYVWTVSKTGGGKELDTDAMKADGVYEKYLTKDKAPTVRIVAAPIKKEGK